MKTFNYKLLDNVSEAADFNSDPVKLRHTIAYSITAKCDDGNAVGSMKLQASNDYGELGSSVATWVDITSPTTSVKAIDASDATKNPISWNAFGIGYKWVRVVYTRTSGTSKMTITVNGKNQ